MSKVKLCKFCKKHGTYRISKGYTNEWADDLYICPDCRHEMVDVDYPSNDFNIITKISYEPVFVEHMINLRNNNSEKYTTILSQIRKMTQKDCDVLKTISKDPAFLEAMIALKEKDIIEYELKMSQFRSQVSQKEKAKEVEAKKPTCPRCGSTDISETTKGFTFVTGFLNSSDIRMYCKNCHHKWKPNSLNEDITRLINKKF